MNIFAQSPIKIDMNVLPACVAEASDSYEGQSCYFAGWGFTFSRNFT